MTADDLLGQTVVVIGGSAGTGAARCARSSSSACRKASENVGTAG